MPAQRLQFCIGATAKRNRVISDPPDVEQERTSMQMRTHAGSISLERAVSLRGEHEWAHRQFASFAREMREQTARAKRLVQPAQPTGQAERSTLGQYRIGLRQNAS